MFVNAAKGSNGLCLSSQKFLTDNPLQRVSGSWPFWGLAMYLRRTTQWKILKTWRLPTKFLRLLSYTFRHVAAMQWPSVYGLCSFQDHHATHQTRSKHTSSNRHGIHDARSPSLFLDHQQGRKGDLPFLKNFFTATTKRTSQGS